MPRRPCGCRMNHEARNARALRLNRREILGAAAFAAAGCSPRLLTGSSVTAPGARWSYNQPGYMVLGIMIEQVSGRPYAAFMRERAMDSRRRGRAEGGRSRGQRVRVGVARTVGAASCGGAFQPRWQRGRPR